MGSVKFKVAENSQIEKCPKCGNNTSFTGKAEQVAEDSCEVWIVCSCGYDPTADDTSHRMEDVWGSLDKETILAAIQSSWNYPIEQETKCQKHSS